jgi:hypothetical protein
MGDLGSNSFTMSGYSGNYANAGRNLLRVIPVEDSFVVKMAIAYRNGNKGIDITTGSVFTPTTLINFNVGGDSYYFGGVNLGAAPYNWQYSSESIFTLSARRIGSLSNNNYQISIKREAPFQTTEVYQATYSFASPLCGFKFYCGDTDISVPGTERQRNNLYFNNIIVY